MLAKIKDFVKSHFSDIILFVVIVLLTMIAFATGFILAKYQTKEPITITNKQ